MKNLIKLFLIIRYVSSSLILLCLAFTFFACGSGGGGDSIGDGGSGLGGDLELEEGQIAITVTNPEKILSPVDKSVTFKVLVRGLSGPDTIDVVDIDSIDKSAYGLALSDNTVIVAGENIIKIQYDGTTAVAEINPITLDLIITDGESELVGEPKVVVKIVDGQVKERPIPVTQDNIASFNIYAMQTGASGGLNKHYKLIEDIDWSLAGTTWTAIGAKGGTTNPNQFTGSFDGSLKKISRITINNTNSYQGMFACIGSGAEVKDLGLEDVNITVTSGGQYVGGVAGRNVFGMVQNCYVTGRVRGGDGVGGVVGHINGGGSVQNCYTIVDVLGSGGSVGGIVGQAYEGTVQNCYAAGSVTASGMCSGGIVGYNQKNLVQNCYAINIVNGSGIYVGGIVGFNYQGNALVKNCAALNKIIQTITSSNPSYIGRVAGKNTNILTNNHARSDMIVSGKGYVAVIGHDKEDGATITSTEYHVKTWWINTATFDESVWDIVNDNLPTLKGVGGTQNPVLP